MTRTLRALLLPLFLTVSAAGALAMTPGEALDDPALEQRARDLSANLRCMVCQNQSIDDSDAELARDLRVLVRERIMAGDSDREVIDYLVDRYGEFVLLKPTFSTRNALLWATPAIVLVLGGIAFATYARRRAAPAGPGATLSAEEEARIHALLEGQDQR